MHSFHFKKGDTVIVLSGASKGHRGRVISVDGKNQRAIVEGARMIKKHTRKNQQNPQGAIVTREGTIHISALMRAEVFDARAGRRGKTPAQA